METLFRFVSKIWDWTVPAQEVDMSLKEGDKAPAFTAQTDEGKTVKLSDFKGKNVVLYFYPKDDTPGCTTEACAFRDHRPDFEKKNAVILGVSVDGVDSHTKFKNKYSLPFTLLADVDGKICSAYGVLKEGKKSASRWTFVIDPQGTIKKIFPQVKVDGHFQEVLTAIG